MKKPVLKHRRELAEQGIEQTPGEVQEFEDAAELFRAVGPEIPAEELVDVVAKLKDAAGKRH